MSAPTFADLSDYQPRFEAVQYRKGGHPLVALKATEGTDWISSVWEQRARAAHEAGLPVWHYHFCHPDTDPDGTGEAAHFWRTVAPHFHNGDRLVLDIELHHPQGAAGLVIYTHRVDQRLTTISDQQAIAYTYSALLDETGPAWNVASREWWIANYGSRVWTAGRNRRLVAQQFTEHERFAGIGTCDGNRLLLAGRRSARRQVKLRRRALSKRQPLPHTPVKPPHV